MIERLKSPSEDGSVQESLEGDFQLVLYKSFSYN